MLKRLIIFVCFCFISACVLAQSISYSATNKSIEIILSDIEQISPYRFSYNSDIFGAKPKIISVQNATIDEFLKKLLGSSFSYNIVGNQIIISTRSYAYQSKPVTKSIKMETPKIEHVMVYDTVTIYDHKTIYDTIFTKLQVIDTLQRIKTINKPQYILNHLHTNNKCLSFSAQFGIQSNSILFYNNGEYSKKLNQQLQSGVSFGAEILTKYKRNNLLISCGLGYYNHRLENSFSTQSTTIDPNKTFADTVWFWKFNEKFTYYKYNNGDSVAVRVLDSVYTYQIFENQMKVEQHNMRQTTITSQYVAVPLGIGFHYNITNTFAIQPSILVNALFLTFQRGEISTKSFTETYNIKEISNHITYSATLSCNILYSLERQFSIAIRPFFTIMPTILNSQKTNTQALLTSFGIHCGFSYTIPYALF